MDGTVLIADDDRTIRTVLTQAFTRAGCKVHATSSLVTLMRWVEEGKGDLVISDVVMPDGNGLEMLPKISEARDELPVIVISAQNTIMTAIKATEAKAFDYLPKPFDLPDLMKRSARALALKRRVNSPASSPKPAENELPLVGRTGVMQEIYRLIARVVNGDLPVLISGESGTGKSLIARTIHDFSDRRALPFVVVNPSNLTTPDGLDRMLARAGTGTLVFDEVSDLEWNIQGQVARLMDRLGDNSPRIMATTQADLAAKMEAGDFRQDLFYRLNGVSLAVPALRDRVDDIPLLAEFFLGRNTDIEGTHVLSPDAMKLIRSYSWPGNVRQLENCLKRLAATSAQAEITLSEAEQALGGQPEIEPVMQRGQGDKLSASIARHLQRYFDLHGGALPPPGLYPRILHEMERPLLEIALEATGGNQAKCADLLGINRNTLRKKITDLDIRVTRRRKLV
ncbi:response regulator [Profundibacter amoris]|uniref:DNA-binding transcriptional regulator NtrC n=1 Tax=Profundibacter amoris TaxID=2171755 RepID=A0A347UGD1_9RHOB|nr:sigma-54 dependent transcriptional regulator [Profundibacter amoris]AXX97909.1 sigma-54-dependent Fis family transcriptional regulator [Profundibacter amoris]